MKWVCNDLIVIEIIKSYNRAQNFGLGLPYKTKFWAGPKKEQNDANWHHFRAKSKMAEIADFGGVQIQSIHTWFCSMIILKHVIVKLTVILCTFVILLVKNIEFLNSENFILNENMNVGVKNFGLFMAIDQ